MTCAICNSVFRQFGCHVCGSMPVFNSETGKRDKMVNRGDMEILPLVKTARQVVRAHGAMSVCMAHGSRSEQLASFRRSYHRIEDRLIFAIDLRRSR